MTMRAVSAVLFVLLSVLVFAPSDTTVGKPSYIEIRQSGFTQVSGLITQNTTWTAVASPYVVVGDVVVDLSVFLSIQPGVTVRFVNSTNLVVDGCLLAQGNSFNQILFTSNNTPGAIGDWGTINIRRYSTGTNHIEHVKIEYSSTALTLAADCSITDTLFHYNINGISLVDSGDVLIGSTQMMNNSGYGINGSTSKNIEIIDCTVSMNTGNGISASASQNATIENCAISMNGAGASITGYGILVENTTVDKNNGQGMSLDCGPHGWTYVNNSSFLANSGGGLSFGGNDLKLVDTKMSNNAGSGLSAHLGLEYRANTNAHVQSCTFLNNTNGISASGGGEYFGSCICDVYDCILERNGATGIACAVGTLFSVNCSSIRYNQDGVRLNSSYKVGSSMNLNNSDVANNENGLVLTNYTYAGANANLYNSTIRNNSNCGVSLGGSSLNLNNCVIEGSLYGIKGLGERGSSVTASSSIIANNSIGVSLPSTGYSPSSFGASFITVANNTDMDIQCQSCTLLGCNVYNTTTNINCSSCTLENCNVSDASTNIQCDSGTLEYCSVYNGTLVIKMGSGALHYCNFYDDKEYDLENTGSNDINATYNWWGTTDKSLVEEHIYDFYDNFSLGRVFIDPFLTAPANVEVTPPIISDVAIAPSLPNYDEDVVVSSKITDNVAVDVALLSYTASTSWHNVSMSASGDLFTGTIPAQPYGTTVQYKVYSNDTNGNWAASEVYSYTVVDTKAPQILSVNASPTCPYLFVPSNVTRANEPTLIIANISEPATASGMAKVLFSYRVDSGKWWNTSMDYNSTSGLWTVTIPAQSNATNTVEFFIEAYDNAGNIATSPVQVFSVRALLGGDINGDGKVDMKDIGYAARHYGEHYP